MRIGYGSERGRYNEILLLHLIGAIMILLCHFMQKAHISALGELLISGVPLFLFVSGFLAGLKPAENRGQWLKRRAVRIFVPYYLWIIPCMLILWLSNHEQVSLSQFIFMITNTQGLNYIYWKSEIYSSVLGLGHLWFTTKIMLCYLLVPLFERVLNTKKSSIKQWMIIFAALIVVVQPLAIKIGIQLSYIITFFLGFTVSKFGCEINDKMFTGISVVCVLITAVRLVLKKLIDGSDYYDRYIALVSAAAIGIWIFFFIFWIFYKKQAVVDFLTKNKVIVYLSEISFEIYITHFWFLNGKWQVSNYIHNPIIADAIVCVLTVIFSSVLHIISQKVINCFSEKKVRANR